MVKNLFRKRDIDADKKKKEAKTMKELKVEILIPKLTEHCFSFLGYLADSAGWLTEIYNEIVDKANVEIDAQWKEYDRQVKRMKIEKDFSKKLRMPPPRIMPEKNYGGMFKKWLKLEEKEIYDTFIMILEDRKYSFKFKKNDIFSFKRLEDMPDAVILFIEGHPMKWRPQFVENVSLKRSMIMHLFFGTQKIFFMEYFDHDDFKLRHECNQKPIVTELDIELNKMFKYLEDEYEAPCDRIDIMQFCIKKRLDKPAALSSNLHLKKAKKMFHGKDRFAKRIDRSFV
jgi:hypothetical protein